MVKLESHEFASLACQLIKTLESIIKWQEHSGNQSVSQSMINAGIFCGHRSAKPSAVSMGRKSTSSKGLLRVAWERKLLAPVVRKVDNAMDKLLST